MSYLNGISQKPVFRIYNSNNELVKVIQLPLPVKAIRYEYEREIDVTEYLFGKTSIEVLGYKHNWVLDYEKFMKAEDVIYKVIELLRFADDNNYYLMVKILEDSRDDLFIKCVIVNSKILLSLDYNGLQSNLYEGLKLEVRSVERTPTFWAGWKLINPFENKTIGFETNMGSIKLN